MAKLVQPQAEKQQKLSLLLELEPRIGLQITHVHFGTVFSDLRVFFAHQPSHVREEKAPAGVVWISVRVAELVVDAVIAHPLDDAVLEGDGLEEQQHQLHPLVGFVAFVGPQAMCTRGDSVGTDDREHKSCNQP